SRTRRRELPASSSATTYALRESCECTMSKTVRRAPKKEPRHDWSRFDAMTDEERHAAAMADPDARPMTDEEWARAPKTPRVTIIRRAFKLSQEEFAKQFHIPIGTLRDWEQG